MAARFRHFAINADNVARARAFYEGVFGWSFDPPLAPDFHQLHGAGPGLVGALQKRRELEAGRRMTGFETTFAVEDLGATIVAIEAAGGRLVAGPYEIDSVGALIWFEDTEGNLVGAMQYAPGVFE